MQTTSMTVCANQLPLEGSSQRQFKVPSQHRPKALQLLTCSAGRGAKGPRLYHWARVPIRPVQAARIGYWLLPRRSLTDRSDIAYNVCFGLANIPLRELVHIAGIRCAIEETFQTGKGEIGLDQYQVRRYDA
jgi:hypothetical protein